MGRTEKRQEAGKASMDCFTQPQEAPQRFCDTCEYLKIDEKAGGAICMDFFYPIDEPGLSYCGRCFDD